MQFLYEIALLLEIKRTSMGMKATMLVLLGNLKEKSLMIPKLIIMIKKEKVCYDQKRQMLLYNKS